jgi:transposase
MFTKSNKITRTQITTAAKAAVVQNNAGVPTVLSAAQRALVRNVFMGADLHKRTCMIATALSGSAVQPPQTIETANTLEWVKQQLLRYPNAQFHIGYEAGPCGYWLCRELNKLERVNCQVMAPEILNPRRKNDKRDARALCVKLRNRVEENDPKAYSAVRVPTLEQELKRSVLRQRSKLLRSYAQHAMRCKSAALLHGCELKGKFWKGGEWEQKLPAKLPGQIRVNIARERKIILAIIEQIEDCNKQIDQMLEKEDPVPYGIGQLTWLSLKLEVCDWKRFSGRRAVASYTGLCPGEHTTGERRVELSIDKMGNRTMRRELIEAAWRLYRFQPHYPPVMKFFGRGSGGRARRRAIVAVARQLAIDLWRLNTGKASAQEVGLCYTKEASELPRAPKKPAKAGREEGKPRATRQAAGAQQAEGWPEQARKRG